MSKQTVTLSTLKGGALEERFQRELAKLLANIRDPNTSVAGVRRIDIQLSFKPADDRQYAAITARVSAKLAPDRPIHTFTLFGEDGDGCVIAVEQTPMRGEDPRQTEMGEPAKVTSIKGRKPRKESP